MLKCGPHLGIPRVSRICRKRFSSSGPLSIPWFAYNLSLPISTTSLAISETSAHEPRAKGGWSSIGRVSMSWAHDSPQSPHGPKMSGGDAAFATAKRNVTASNISTFICRGRYFPDCLHNLEVPSTFFITCLELAMAPPGTSSFAPRWPWVFFRLLTPWMDGPRGSFAANPGHMFLAYSSVAMTDRWVSQTRPGSRAGSS